MTSDPLSELLAHLERDGDGPLAWVGAHAPDGDLRRAWEACGDVAQAWSVTEVVRCWVKTAG